jgi:hypothetical protein
VARGDVRRVVLEARGLGPQEIYARAVTWGQFTAATALPAGRARLVVYGRGGRVETLPLDLQPGHPRTIQ